jgi:hypothetical protein
MFTRCLSDFASRVGLLGKAGLTKLGEGLRAAPLTSFERIWARSSYTHTGEIQWKWFTVEVSATDLKSLRAESRDEQERTWRSADQP